jgi:hypothetical protein
MKKTLYLIRHGKIHKDGNYDTLNKDGVQFAENLPTLLKEERIDFIASVKGKDRCKNTVRQLIIKNVKFIEYDKIDFYFLKPYYDALNHSTSVICYGYEEIGEILNELKIIVENRNELYEIILKINLEDKTCQKIPIGNTKTKEL